MNKFVEKYCIKDRGFDRWICALPAIPPPTQSMVCGAPCAHIVALNVIAKILIRGQLEDNGDLTTVWEEALAWTSVLDQYLPFLLSYPIYVCCWHVVSTKLLVYRWEAVSEERIGRLCQWTTFQRHVGTFIYGNVPLIDMAIDTPTGKGWSHFGDRRWIGVDHWEATYMMHSLTVKELAFVHHYFVSRHANMTVADFEAPLLMFLLFEEAKCKPIDIVWAPHKF